MANLIRRSYICGRGLISLIEKLPAEHWEIADGRSHLSECMSKLHRYDEAESLLVDGYEGLKARKGGRDRLTVQALRRVVNYYQASGRKQRAAFNREMMRSGP